MLDGTDLRKTDFGALIDTIPTQLALVFFGLLHVPINVPGEFHTDFSFPFLKCP